MSKSKTPDKYKDSLTSLYPPCFYCKHVEVIGGQVFPFGHWTCAAFPLGIPGRILDRDIPHDKPMEGFQTGDAVFESKVYDNGDGPEVITFEGKWHPAKGE